DAHLHRLDGRAVALHQHFVPKLVVGLLEPERNVVVRRTGHVFPADLTVAGAIAEVAIPDVAELRERRLAQIDVTRDALVVGADGTLVHDGHHHALPGVLPSHLDAGPTRGRVVVVGGVHGPEELAVAGVDVVDPIGSLLDAVAAVHVADI